MMAGYAAELFLEKLPEGLMCIICLNVMRGPQQCRNGHMFCDLCIHGYLLGRNTCPTCECDLQPSSLSQNLYVKNIIRDLRIRCPTNLSRHSISASVCYWVGSVDNLENHLERECGFVLVSCSNIDCMVTFERRFLQEHDDSCDHKLVACKNCDLILKRIQLVDHCLLCYSRNIPCPRECGVMIDRPFLSQHLSVCLLEQVECPDCKELMQRQFFVSHENTCSQKFEPCSFCEVPMKRFNKIDHEKKRCPHRLISCLHAECGAMFPKRLLHHHQSQCPLEEVSCPRFHSVGCVETCIGQRRDDEDDRRRLGISSNPTRIAN